MTTQSVSSDPVLLGVSMPLTMTRAAALEVAGAWRECLMALVAAAKAKMAPEKPANSAPEAPPPTSPSVTA